MSLSVTASSKEEASTLKGPLTLNIGGVKYVTSLHTLTQFAESVFPKMFSGKFSTKPEADGSYFIDRDGENFKYILNYMRTNTLMIPKQDPFLIKQLYQEAVYYQITPLIKILQFQQLGTTILDPSNLKKLTAFLQLDNPKLSLLVKINELNQLHYPPQSRMEMNQTKIRMLCTDIYPILFLFKTSNSIFGVYSQVAIASEIENKIPMQNKQAWFFKLFPKPQKYAVKKWISLPSHGNIIVELVSPQDRSRMTRNTQHKFARENDYWFSYNRYDAGDISCRYLYINTKCSVMEAFHVTRD